MVVRNLWRFVLLCAVVIFTTACSTTISEQSDKAIQSAEMIFKGIKEETNSKSGDIQFYLPADYEILDEQDYSIVIGDKDKQIIIFLNPLEDQTSSILIEEIKKNKEQYLAVETFEKKGMIGLITIKEIEEESYELSIAVGKVKVTTLSNLDDLSKDAEELMLIATSVKQ